MKTILCVEDELHILTNNQKMFTKNGFHVLTAVNVAGAREHLATGTPDAIILDIMLPDGNGLDILRELRAAGNTVPVLMLTAWGETADKIRGLQMGANDYMAKPFDYGELLARVQAMLRSVEQVPERIRRGALSLDVVSGQAFLNDSDILLTQKEFALLVLFIQHENRIISAEYLYEKVWGQPMIGNTRALSNMIYKLRKGMEGSGYDILTKRGHGFCFKAYEK